MVFISYNKQGNKLIIINSYLLQLILVEITEKNILEIL